MTSLVGAIHESSVSLAVFLRFRVVEDVDPYNLCGGLMKNVRSRKSFLRIFTSEAIWCHSEAFAEFLMKITAVLISHVVDYLAHGHPRRP